MTHDEIMNLLGAYALDAVDGEERAIVDRHLGGCPQCRAEVNEHREVAALLAHEGADAPAGPWERIADALEEAPPPPRIAPLTALQPPAPSTPDMAAPDIGPAGRIAPETGPPAPAHLRPRRRRRWAQPAAAAAAAASLVIVVLLGAQIRQQDQRIEELQDEAADPLGSELAEALDAPDSQPLELASEDEGIVLDGAVTTDGLGYLRTSDLPSLDDDRTYQLWGASGDELVSLGVLGADPDIISFPAAAYEAFAITEEAAPGVVTSTNPAVVAGETSE